MIKIIGLLPCRNESWILPTYLKNVLPVVDEIIVIDDNSTDNTKQILKSASDKIKLHSNNEILKSVSQKFTPRSESRYLSIYKAKLPEEWLKQNEGFGNNLYYIYNNINGSRKCLKYHSIDIFEFTDFKDITVKKTASDRCDLKNTEQLFIKIEIGCHNKLFKDCAKVDYEQAIQLYNHYINFNDDQQDIVSNSKEYFSTIHLFKILKYNNKKIFILVPFNYPTYAITLKSEEDFSNEISVKPMRKDDRPFQQFIQIDPRDPKDNSLYCSLFRDL